VPQAHDARDSLSVDRTEFAAHLDAIVAGGHTPMTIGEIADALRNERSIPDRAMAITFDDVNESTLEALENLCSRGLRATVYVIAGEIGAKHGLKNHQLADLASREEQIQLGSHTINHPRLDELSLPEIEREVGESQARLEESAKCRIDTFAYPYGAYDQRVRATVIAAGYRSAAAVKNALSHSQDDPWAIARWTVRNTTSAAQIAAMLDGRQKIPLAWERERLRTRGYRIVRKLRRKVSSGS
jgi:peptidoglycan/xylan/chitin deacetylase (PgdA/CDA1 family)